MKLETIRVAVGAHLHAAAAELDAARDRALDDTSDARKTYHETIIAAFDAVEESLVALQQAMLQTGPERVAGRAKPRNHKKGDGWYRLDCEACGTEFDARNPKRRTCYDHKVSDIGAIEPREGTDG